MIALLVDILLKQVKRILRLIFYHWQGKMDAAASMIEKAIIANPSYAEAYNNLGLYLFLPSLCFYILFTATLLSS